MTHLPRCAVIEKALKLAAERRLSGSSHRMLYAQV
jgi:hypothetical protein